MESSSVSGRYYDRVTGRTRNYFLDLAALGRQEDWEEPKGRATVVRGAVPDFSA